MTRLRIGYRSIFNKKYEIELFDFLIGNTDQFNIPYNGLDLWNSKESETKVLQVEERIEYFHFMYIPVFPVTHVWTLRKEDGKLYSLESVKYKIESRVKKSRYPIYTFMLPLLVLLSISIYILSVYGKKHLRAYRQDKKKQITKELLLSKLDSAEPPFYIVLAKDGLSKNTLQRVDSMVDQTYFISKLPLKIDTFEYGTLDYTYYSALEKYRLIQTQVSKDSLYSLVYGNSYLHLDNEIKKVLSAKELETPKLEISFNDQGLEIKNLGKPITFINFTDNSPEKGLWKFEPNLYLDTNKSILGMYSQKNVKAKNNEEIRLTLTFDDGEEFIEYEVSGTYTDIGGRKSFVENQINRVE
ncbi:hypothetical protein [Pseudozobellia thermophila]|uniref:Uncharacterized protein n=1 Tax=Pseudozobellia thermophila TaxID=192903 RepID=A0A1M6L2W1_9FLAO|nr:hypothetical protein [Pseudozobellia thermophila]SHJ65561.1 hypothetical protein SAMN04488513_1072 [Pseudozobellia thermophila]